MCQQFVAQGPNDLCAKDDVDGAKTAQNLARNATRSKSSKKYFYNNYLVWLSIGYELRCTS
jgi:hypothetical protein